MLYAHAYALDADESERRRNSLFVGFPLGTSLLPNSPILMQHLMDQTATIYSDTTLTDMSGATIKTVMEDVADNLFNPYPYYQQGDDMVRVGGMTYAIDPKAKMGARI